MPWRTLSFWVQVSSSLAHPFSSGATLPVPWRTLSFWVQVSSSLAHPFSLGATLAVHVLEPTPRQQISRGRVRTNDVPVVRHPRLSSFQSDGLPPSLLHGQRRRPKLHPTRLLSHSHTHQRTSSQASSHTLSLGLKLFLEMQSVEYRTLWRKQDVHKPDVSKPIGCGSKRRHKALFPVARVLPRETQHVQLILQRNELFLTLLLQK